MRLLDRLRTGVRDIASLDDYALALSQWGYGVSGSAPEYTLQGKPVEAPSTTFAGFASAYKTNGPVFACMLARMQVFSGIRFTWQRVTAAGGPSSFFGTPMLSLFEAPWAGGTTQDLLARVIQDADLAGNSYWYVDESDMNLVRLRPDWVSIAVGQRPYGGWQRLGYFYQDRSGNADGQVVWFDPTRVAHFAPIPDPLADYRGMSWLTPILRELQTDNQINVHKQAFFVNGATPNMVISYDPAVSEEVVARFIAMLDRKHKGAVNAYKTMHLGGGATPTVVGKDFKQIDLKAVQGAGETRIAAAAGVPPVIVGLSEGLEAATYSNYGQARRRFADGTIHPLWANVAGCFGQIVTTPGPGTRLWYDARGVPFLREDAGDAANIQNQRASTVRTLVDAGYTTDSVIAAVEADDFTLLVHTGLFSVQLQKPGSGTPPTETDMG